MNLDFHTWLFAILGAALSYTGFCRAVVMTKNTQPSIRYAMSALTAAGFAVSMASLFVPTFLSWSVAALLGAMLYVQIATARFWLGGRCPVDFELPLETDHDLG
jgi:hypothetical protein